MGVPSEVLSVPWGAEPRKGQPYIPRTRVRSGRCRREGPTGKRRQILPVASSSLPPGLTCPDVLRYRWVSTDAPQRWVSLRGTEATSGRSQVSGLCSLPLWSSTLGGAPLPGRPHPPTQGNPRTAGPGTVHTVYSLLWESQEHRACHTSKAEGQQGHFSGGLQLEDSATGGKGSTPLLRATSERTSPPTTKGQS